MSQAPAPSRVVDETEQQLISTAQEAVSQCRWVVGECAAKWTQRYARGRTDADFAALVGITPDQVFQRRRVWETFGTVRGDFRKLKWSHFYAALTWDDALESLRWAAEMEAPVAEMRAWRRARHGEDLSVLVDDEVVRYLPTEPEFVQDPSQFAAAGERGEARPGTFGAAGERTASSSVARQAGDDGGEYSPFRADAASPAPAGGHTSRQGEPPELPTPEQLVKRLTSTLDRCAKVLTPEFRKEFRRLPEPVRLRLFESAKELAECVSHLR
ncbi:MAG: hypothetical protein EXS05_03415 [Planctomycetaceae bacterium]|nr:hypothetical protein [Planctomycetaceae bacterium]